jgi:hypothetical protein
MHETYASFGYTSSCCYNLHVVLIMDVYVYNKFCKSRSYFVLGQSNDLKEPDVGKGSIFTNHVDKAWTIKREVMPKELQDKSINLSKSRDGCYCLHQFESLFRGVQTKKTRYSEAPSSFHSNTSRTNEFEDTCKELWRKHWALRKFWNFRTDFIAEVK